MMPSSQWCRYKPSATIWFSLPVEEDVFCLDKGSFRDALSTCCAWQLPNMSSKCACRMLFSINYAMMCHKGGLPTMRHNEFHDLTAALMVRNLVPVQTCEDEPRLDIRVSHVWARWKETLKFTHNPLSLVISSPHLCCHLLAFLRLFLGPTLFSVHVDDLPGDCPD